MTRLIFAITALLWGCGALATTFQAGVTPAPWSVAIRMLLTGIILLFYNASTGRPGRIPMKDAPYVALQGTLFFGVAFTAFYEATSRLPSGVAAIGLATSSIFAALIGRVALGLRWSPRVITGSIVGVLGMLAVFVPEIHMASSPQYAAGIAWALGAALATAAGTVVGARNQRAGVPGVATIGWGALFGASASAAWALCAGDRLVFDGSPDYLLSLLYLTIGASCATFLLYFRLVERIGASSAAYIFTVVPIVAICLSALFEGLHLAPSMVIGTVIILVGNLIVLSPRASHDTARALSE
jgi:drug/metabolite transporter (DMT)-like permease